MALSNEELTEQLRDLKKRVKDLEVFRASILWERALAEAGLATPQEKSA